MKGLYLVCLYIMMLCTSLAFGQAASAQPGQQAIVPQLMNFSGHAADASGKVISGAAGATFAIYRDQDGGAPLWIETQTVAADAKGNFTAQLGAAKSEGLPLDVFASGEARWLGVSINGGAEQPRVLLMSVPYALKAADAQTLGGLPASAFMLAGSAKSAVSSASRASATPADSPVTAPPPATSNVTTTGGTVNALPLFSTSTNIQNSIVSQTGTTSVSIKGKLALPAAGTATATAGKNSQAQTLAASAFNSSTSTAVPQTFQWQAEAANNNTTTASGTLNLLFGQGTTAPAETGLKVASNGQITFATGQTFPGTGIGTITGVTTVSGSGLTGGGNSGALNLGLLSTCSSNQILKWSGSAWACASDANSGGTVTSVALSAPSSDFTVTGSPITTSGTLGLNWVVPPDTKATPNAIAKRDANGAINASLLAAQQSASGYSVSGVDNSSSINPGKGVAGVSVYGDGVYGISTQGIGVNGGSTSNYGVSGTSYSNNGVYGSSNQGAGVFGISTDSPGVYGQNTTGGGSQGLRGVGDVGAYGGGTTWGVFGGSGGGTGVYGYGGANGVWGVGSSASSIGVSGTDDSGGIGVYGEATAGGYAADFAGNGVIFGDFAVHGNLSKNGGSFKIDHPLDPANKYLYHSFVESPDMKNIYDGVATLDASGEAVVEFPAWFETLNRDFRYTLTAIGIAAPNLHIAEKVHNNKFRIGGGQPGMEVSWQVTGIRQDAWANAHRIPVEEEKPQEDRGTYLNPELYGASAEQSLDAKVNARFKQRFSTFKQSLPASQDRRASAAQPQQPN